MANTQKSKQSTEVPSSSTDSIASCSSKADEPNECSKNADSSLDAPKPLEKITEPDATANANTEKNETDRDETNKDDENMEETVKEATNKEIVEKLNDEVDCDSSSPKSETQPNDSDDQKDELAISTSKFSTNDENNGKDDDTLIDVEDPDDYLLYLESILVKIHSRFYTHYDETKQV